MTSCLISKCQNSDLHFSFVDIARIPSKTEVDIVRIPSKTEVDIARIPSKTEDSLDIQYDRFTGEFSVTIAGHIYSIDTHIPMSGETEALTHLSSIGMDIHGCYPGFMDRNLCKIVYMTTLHLETRSHIFKPLQESDTRVSRRYSFF